MSKLLLFLAASCVVAIQAFEIQMEFSRDAAGAPHMTVLHEEENEVFLFNSFHVNHPDSPFGSP